jgi:hypothetical protein
MSAQSSGTTRDHSPPGAPNIRPSPPPTPTITGGGQALPVDPATPGAAPGTTVAGQHSGAASAAVTTVTAATGLMPGISPPTKTRLLQ